jgi:hypothetical protein
MALFIRLIIRTFQLIFLAGTIFFSHNKSANSVFSRLISTAERGLYASNLSSCDTIQISNLWILNLCMHLDQWLCNIFQTFCMYLDQYLYASNRPSCGTIQILNLSILNLCMYLDQWLYVIFFKPFVCILTSDYIHSIGHHVARFKF